MMAVMASAVVGHPSLKRCGVGRSVPAPATFVAVVAVMVTLLTTSAPAPVTAHSSMTSPQSMSFTRDCRISRGGGGSARNCPGPCPNVMLRRYGIGSSPSRPAATYARGQRVRVRWGRNNHEGGFVRWSIVPVGSKMDAKVHEQMAFHWGCWSAGRFRCRPGAHRKEFCMDDRLGKATGYAYQDSIQVPRIYPDGDYVLSFAWYGGVRYNLPNRRPVLSSFGDYYDCSYIRIVGGGVVARTHQPTFRPGMRTRFPDRCVSSVNRLGACVVEPCTRGGDPQGPSLFTGGEMVPAQFSGGAKPPAISTWWFPAGTPAGGGVLGIDAAYVADVHGRRRWRLNQGGVNVVSLNAGLPQFTIEAALTGNVRVDGVEFRAGGRVLHVERQEPWFLTPRKASGKGLVPWGEWTAGKEILLTITPIAVRGQAVKIQFKNFRIKVMMNIA